MKFAMFRIVKQTVWLTIENMESYNKRRNRKMSPKQTHVVPNSSRGGWDVKHENASRVSKHCDTKQEAMSVGRKISQNQGTEFIPHGRDGRIQNPDSHGHDPCPPKDKH